MRALSVLLLLVPSVVLAAQGATVTIRCPERCSVLLEGKPGRQLSDSHWEFTQVPAGKQRLEVKGLLGRGLVSTLVEIPKASEVGVYLDSKGQLKVSPGAASSSTAAGKGSRQERPEPGKGKGSVLHIRCQKPCSVSVDHAHKPSGDTHTITIQDVSPGTRDVEVRFALGGKKWREPVKVPPASEVFLYASDGGLQITNTRKLGK